MRKSILILFSGLLLFSCGETETEDEVVDQEAKEQQSETEFYNRSKREVMAKLNIPPNEKFVMKVYREAINSDTLMDAIVTVNRLDFAMEEAIRSGNQAKKAEVGFMGNYNYFLYYDGAKDQFSVPIPVPSTPGRPLDVSFANILSPTRKDVIIEYRVRNSGWKSYFSVFNDADLALVFQWKYFDKAGDDKPEALLHKVVYSDDSRYGDIYIYNSEIDGYNKNIGDIYQYVPSITKEKGLLYQFTFDPRFGKYKLVQ